jgi:lipoic acid synthetase
VTGGPYQGAEPSRAVPRPKARIEAQELSGTGNSGRKPPWLKRPLPRAEPIRRMERLLREFSLQTICQSALCPNIGSCYEHGTATFLIMGDVCTRTCSYCGVRSGAPGDVDPREPERVAEAASRLCLRHVVVTSVTRDDLDDGGAAHYVATIRAVRARLPEATVEVLVPDFGGRWEDAGQVTAEAPEVFGHNLETVPRLYPLARRGAEYQRSLALLRRAANEGRCLVKTGLIVGLGETEGEIRALLEDVAKAGVRVVTIGQYLQPTSRNLPVAAYVELQAFDRYRTRGEALGLQVHSGPFVRSSFEAGESLALALESRGMPPKAAPWIGCRDTIARTYGGLTE